MVYERNVNTIDAVYNVLLSITSFYNVRKSAIFEYPHFLAPMFTRKELMIAYGCCTNKIREMLREAGITHRHRISSLELEHFKAKWGNPRKQLF